MSGISFPIHSTSPAHLFNKYICHLVNPYSSHSEYNHFGSIIIFSPLYTGGGNQARLGKELPSATEAASSTFPHSMEPIECSVWGSAHSVMTDLQDFPAHTPSCTAPDPEPQPTNLFVDVSGRLLFAPAPSVRSRPRSERCRTGGLRSTPFGFQRFPHANPKPDRPLRQGDGKKQKTHWGTSFRLGCRISMVLDHAWIALTKPAPQWVLRIRCLELRRVTSPSMVELYPKNSRECQEGAWVAHIKQCGLNNT